MNKTPNLFFYILSYKRHTSDFCLDKVVSELEDAFFQVKKRGYFTVCYQKACPLGITIQRQELRMYFVHVTWTIQKHLIQQENFLTGRQLDLKV